MKRSVPRCEGSVEWQSSVVYVKY